MSLERAALRLAAVMALSNGYVAPYPTIAGPNVFDSRVDAIEGGSVGDLAPLAVVFTDDDDGEVLDAVSGGPPFRQTVNLIFELSIGMVGPLVDKDDQPLTDEHGNALTGLIPVATEPELELMLDLFERQVAMIFKRPTTPWAARISPSDGRHIARIDGWRSLRFVEREGQKRLAVRQVAVKVMLPQPAEDADETAGEAGVVPEPLGSLLEAIIEADGPYAPSAEAMQTLLTDNASFGPLVLPALERVRLKEADLGGGNLTADGPARPDGVAEIELPQE